MPIDSFLKYFNSAHENVKKSAHWDENIEMKTILLSKSLFLDI